MSSGKTLRQLIKAGAAGDLDAFLQVSTEVIREEHLKQHHLLEEQKGDRLLNTGGHKGGRSVC